MRDYDTLFIGGRWVEPASTKTIEVISPHSEEVVGRVPEATTEDVDRAVAAAREAFDQGDWPHMPIAERLQILRTFQDLYMANLMPLADIITEEMGSPIGFSQLAQTPAPLMMLQTFLNVAETYPWEETRPGSLGAPVVVRREPVGVVGA